MKVKIKNNYKKILLGSIIALILVLFTLLFIEIKIPVYKDETVKLYNYNTNSDINFNVSLIPNLLFEESSIGEGEMYITEYIENINSVFYYEFIGQDKADIKGDYEIIAQVEGYTGEGDTYKPIWTKDFILLPKTNFNMNDKALSLREQITIDIEDYNNFASQVMEEAKIGSSVRLTVFMKVHAQVNTEFGVVEETSIPSITMPLKVNYFQITKNVIGEKPGSLEETKQVQLPANKKKIIIYSCLSGVLLIILIFIVFFTNGINTTDLFEKELKKIFKNHGSRLVALNDEIAVTHEDTYFVKSMDDLVKIADEIGQPITYQYSPYLKDMTEFYVFNDKKLYVFSLNQKFQEGNLEYFSDNEETSEANYN